MGKLDDRVYITLIFMIIFNFAFWWIGSMGFFDSGIEGMIIEYDIATYGFTNLIFDGFLGVGLGIMAGLASNFLRINAFAVIMFTEIFWLPYTKTVAIFYSIFAPALVVFAGFIVLLSTLMFFMYAYTLIKLASTTGGY